MKLFKKVMASVLAGVLALSMVACGTTAVVPPVTDIPTNPTASAETNVLAAVNFVRNKDYGHFVDAVQVEEGNSARAALAETVADLLSANPNQDHESGVWTRDGAVYVPVATIVSVMNRKGYTYVPGGANPAKEKEYDLDGLFVVGNDQIKQVKMVIITGVQSATDKEVYCMKFFVEDVQKSVFGSYAKQQLANVGYKMGSQPSNIGIAQVKTNGNAIILVGKKGVNLAIAPNSNLQNALGGNNSTIG